ncbi:MAG: lysylphosphatidylglycerol synthase transmembrane domain-containing protein [Methyloligellaceae bacterium]
MLKSLLRFGVTGFTLFFTFQSIPLRDVINQLSDLNWFYFVLGVAALHASQLVSAFRTRLYLKYKGVELSPGRAFSLHYVGGLFNMLLPGTVSGDAYKAWVLKNEMDRNLRPMLAVMIANRANGLWLLFVLLAALLLLRPPVLPFTEYPAVVIVVGLLLVTVIYNFAANLIWGESLFQQYHAGIYSFGVQIMVVFCLYFLSLALGLENWIVYLCLMLGAIVVAMVPVSIGGVGIREYILLHSSPFLGANATDGVSLALAFSLISLTVPVIGAGFYLGVIPQSRPPASS